MSDKLVKLYKNPHRSVEDTKGEEATHQHYLPQYRTLGVVPEVRQPTSAEVFVPKNEVVEDLGDNPRTRLPSIIRVADQPDKYQHAKSGMVNVGNNREHTWSGVDDEIFDDISSVVLDPDRPMIDNNEVVEEASFSIDGTTIPLKSPPKPEKKFLTEKELQTAIESNIEQFNIPSIKEDEYILMIDNVIVDQGSADLIQEQANLLIFGDHELCAGNPIPVESLTVLKRVKIKVGLFLE